MRPFDTRVPLRTIQSNLTMKIDYITNRIGLATVKATPNEVCEQAQHLHGQFFHVFNIGGTDSQHF